ncbi:MAG: hypothetical protein LBJ37_14450 [Paucimonas sp.]|nr:hypothetical protein [Paucimonas sp.]
MNVLLGLFLTAIWGGCNADYQDYPLPRSTLGAEVAKRLDQRYHDRRTDCGARAQAAYLCAGILLRTTTSSTEFNTWEPNPATVDAGLGMSFSYLSVLGPIEMLYKHAKGLVIYPGQQVPAGRVTLNVLCAFPVDGATANRDDKGCGKHRLHEGSQACDVQGITTAEQFLEHYTRAPELAYPHQAQCAFNLRDGALQPAADAFEQMLRATNLVPHAPVNDQNEVMIDNPPQGTSAREWPIEAIFYTAPEGLPGAQIDQRNFFDKSGIMLPIIKITLPVRGGRDAAFEYIEGDQVTFPES